MAAALNIHGDVTDDQGTRYENVQVVVRQNIVTLRRGTEQLAWRDQVASVTAPPGAPRLRKITFADGAEWMAERAKRPCGCGG